MENSNPMFKQVVCVANFALLLILSAPNAHSGSKPISKKLTDIKAQVDAFQDPHPYFGIPDLLGITAGYLPNDCLYIADAGNHRIRRVTLEGGDSIITTVAGTGTMGYSGDGSQALSAQINYPR